jgi:diguanylate cyclase (GGDEF)-like protein
MNDPVVTFTAGGEELGRSDDTVEQLGSLALSSLLEDNSWDVLTEAVARPPVQGLELLAVDGRVFDATVSIVPGGVAVFLRDVTRYAQDAAQLPEVEAELARRDEDLRILAEAMTDLGASVDVHELGDLTCRVVARYLGADCVELQTHESTFRHVERFAAEGRPHDRAPDGMLPLQTPLGRVGELRWWRPGGLSEPEEQGLAIIAGRASIGLEHAVLMDATEAKALRDPLTGLLNRAGALQALGEIPGQYAIALLDVDNFKSVNDSFGQDEGDRVLQRLAQVLLQGRFGDVVARWGGEEFLVALPSAEPEGAASRLRRVLERIQENVRAGVQPVTFSCGVAGVGDEGLDRALADADRALWMAKRDGPGTVRVAE